MNIAKTIDHTLLKPEATENQIKTLCDEAKTYGFKSVCVNPTYVAKARQYLAGTDVLVCTVIGFPLGANTTALKVFETQDAIKNGADEIDMVLAIGRLKNNDDEYVRTDIAAVVKAAAGKTVKVIFETALLSDEEIARASKLASAAKAHFVKTSTGFSTRGASMNDVEIMKANIAAGVKIKASGGIRNAADAEAYLKAGVERLGTSSGVAIVQGLASTSTY